MENTIRINVMILGASCFDGMASSMRVRNLFEPLNQSGVIFLNNLIYENDTEIEIKKDGSINNINYKILGFKLLNIFSLMNFLVQGLKFLRDHKLKYHNNVIYNYGNIDIQNILFILYAKFIGYKVVFDIVEDNETFSKFPSIRSRIKIYSSIIFMKLMPYFADSIIVISNHLYKKLSIAARKVPLRLIPITVNFQYFLSYNQNVDLSNLKIFYGGSFGEKDGIEYLIEAFEQIYSKYRNVSLLMTGKGMDQDMRRVTGLIEKSTASKKISFMGYLETDKYYKLLNESDIFCMTRINSKFANAGFPFKLGEFLATGKAVIATNVGDIPNYLTHNVNALIIEPNSIEQLVNSISFLIENPEKIISIGNEGREIALKFFDTQKESQKLFSIFKSLH